MNESRQTVETIFVRKIFVSPDIYENIVTTKISRSTVFVKPWLGKVWLFKFLQSMAFEAEFPILYWILLMMQNLIF